MSKVGTARERHLAQSLSGRKNGDGRLGLSNVLFKPLTLISLILIGCFAFGALIVLGGFAEDLPVSSHAPPQPHLSGGRERNAPRHFTKMVSRANAPAKRRRRPNGLGPQNQ